MFTYRWTSTGKCVPLESYVEEWLNIGVKYIGGCCRTYPSDLVKIKNQVDLLNGNN